MWFAIQTMTGREQEMIDLLVDLADRQELPSGVFYQAGDRLEKRRQMYCPYGSAVPGIRFCRIGRS